MRMLVDHTDDEMGGIFFGGLCSGIPFYKLGDFVGAVINAADAIPDRLSIPGAFV